MDFVSEQHTTYGRYKMDHILCTSMWTTGHQMHVKMSPFTKATVGYRIQKEKELKSQPDLALKQHFEKKVVN